jgi:hypothetical protein
VQAQVFWDVAETVLKSRTKSNWFCAIPTVAALVYIFLAKGIYAAITSLGVGLICTTVLQNLIKADRVYCEIELPPARRRRC